MIGRALILAAALASSALALTVGTDVTGENAQVGLSSNVTRLGGDIAAPGDFGSPVNPGAKDIDFHDALSFILRYGTGTAPTAEGSCYWRTDLNRLECGDGSTTKVFNDGLMSYAIGGTGADGAFTYAGEGSGACSGSICNGGTCTGTTPNGTCTLTFNSRRHQTVNDAAQAWAVTRNYTSITITGGTITVGTPPNLGTSVVWRATGNVSITGGTINLRGVGTKGATSGACASSNAGKGGASSDVNAAGAAGASGNNAGGAGVAAADPVLGPVEWIDLIGTGGGACPVSGQTGAFANTSAAFGPHLGATGGGGGGCAGSCSGTCGGGGRGGGYLSIESAQTITIGTTATIDVRGADGTTGGGGGGGGGVRLRGRVVSNSASTDTNAACSGSTPHICTAGGAAGSSPPTNCGAGAAGGTGLVLSTTVPG
jgi:hypothetical protein